MSEPPKEEDRSEPTSDPQPEPNPSPYIGGPRTETGKATSSRNATKHGCCSDEVLVMANESLADYQALEATWFNAYKPKDDAEKRLVQQLINADWFLERANRTLAQVESQLYSEPEDWTDHQHQKLARFTRYQTSRANSVIKARKAVEDYRKNRAAEVMKAEKHEIHKEKNKPKRSLMDAFNEAVKEKAAREGPPPPK